MFWTSGKQVAISLLAMTKEKRGYCVKAHLPHQIRIIKSYMSSRARIQKIDRHILRGDIEHSIIPNTGFQSVDEKVILQY